MPVDYSLLRPSGPANMLQGFMAGQEAAAQNQLVREKLAMEKQKLESDLQTRQSEQNRRMQVDKAAQFRERLLRAPSPEAARQVVRMQYADPHIGPLMRSAGTLEQDLAEIPDDPQQFEQYRAREAMGAAEWIKSQIGERAWQAYSQRYLGGGAPAMAPTAAAAPAMAAPSAVSAEAAPAPAGAPTQAMPVAAPAEMAPVNALAPAVAQNERLNNLMARYRAVAGMTDPRAKAESQLLAKQIEQELKQPEAPSEERMMIALGIPRTPEGYAQFRRAQMNATPRTPLAVLNERGQPVYVEPERAVGMTPFTPATVRIMGGGGEGGGAKEREKAPAGYRFTKTGDLEPIPGGPAAVALPPKEIQKREASYPKAQLALRSFEDKSDTLLSELKQLRDHPGLGQITGLVAGSLPPVTDAARGANTLLKTIIAKGGFQVLQDMRDASPTGGALGNVSNRENDLLIASFAPIERSLSTKDMKNALNNAISSLERSKDRVREAFDETYAYRERLGGTSAKPEPKPDRGIVPPTETTPGAGSTASPRVNIEAERANARAAIAGGASEASVRERFRNRTGQEL